MRPLAPLAIAAALALVSCAVEGDFPSLAPRPAERNLSTEEPTHRAPAVADDAGLLQQVAELRGIAAEGERAFDAAYGPAEAAAGAAGPPESESWVAAQLALSRLEAAREATMRALGELDRLAVSRSDAPTSEADFAALNAAIAAVGRIAAGQQERIDLLRGRLSGR